MAQAPTATSILQCSRNSRSTCTFSALHRPPSIRPMSQWPQLLDVGQRRAVELDELEQLEQALVDVEQRHVAAEAAGQRDGGDLELASAVRRRLGAHRALLRRVDCDDRLQVVSAAAPIGTAKPRRLGRIAPTGQTLRRRVGQRDVGVGQPAAVAVDDAGACRCRGRRCANTFLPSTSRLARTHSSHRMQRLKSSRMSGCEASTGAVGIELVEVRRHHAEVVGDGLQLAVAALLAATGRSGCPRRTASASACWRSAFSSGGVALDHHARLRARMVQAAPVRPLTLTVQSCSGRAA